MHLRGRVLFVFLAIVPLAPLRALADVPFDAPAGLVPTSASLTSVLDLHQRAVGNPTVPVRTRLIEEHISSGGLDGTFTETFEGGDWSANEHLGSFTTRFGSKAGVQWRQDENGVTLTLKGAHRAQQITDFAIAHAFQNPAKPGAGVRLLGESPEPSAAYVVEVHPPGGNPAWLFLDASSGQLVRREQMVDERRLTETYDDFRITNGTTEPWHGRISIGAATDDLVWTTSSERVDVPLDADQVAIPPDTRQLVQFPPSASTVSLPARIVDRHVILRVMIGGRGYDFLLDTGSSTISVDDEIVSSLRLTSHRHTTMSIAGPVSQSEAIIPEMDIGDLRMRDVVVSASPFRYHPETTTRVVGVIGFDFFAGAVVHIDYPHGIAEAMVPASFQVPSKPDTILDATLDDRVPLVSATVGGVAGNFIFDTGADLVILFTRFTQAHPTATIDQGRGDAMIKKLPLDTAVGTYGVEGFVPLWPVEIQSMDFGGIGFPDCLVYRTQFASPFEAEDVDGIIGQEFLRYFDIYVDYRNARIILVPDGYVDAAP